MKFFTDNLLEKLPEFANQLPLPVELYRDRPKLLADMLGSWLSQVNRQNDSEHLLIKACECISQNYASTKDKSAQQPLVEAMFFPLDYSAVRNLRGRLDDKMVAIGRQYLMSVDGDSFKNF